jgi:hypothetical protein
VFRSGLCYSFSVKIRLGASHAPQDFLLSRRFGACRPGLYAPHGIAAPQILGLIASAQSTPLTCENGVCKAEFSTVCLQEYRPSPIPGAAYKPLRDSNLTLAVAGKSIDVTGKVPIISVRNFSSVFISLPEADILKFGAGGASLSVGAMSSLVPMAQAGDTNPQSAGEIATYTGALRTVVQCVFGEEGGTISAMRDLNQVINKMPDVLSDDQIRFEKVWREVTSAMAKPEARLSSKVVRECRREFKRGMLTNMRSCIVYKHDVLASDTTKKVWKALKPGG